MLLWRGRSNSHIRSCAHQWTAWLWEHKLPRCGDANANSLGSFRSTAAQRGGSWQFGWETRGSGTGRERQSRRLQPQTDRIPVHWGAAEENHAARAATRLRKSWESNPWRIWLIHPSTSAAPPGRIRQDKIVRTVALDAHIGTSTHDLQVTGEHRPQLTISSFKALQGYRPNHTSILTSTRLK